VVAGGASEPRAWSCAYGTRQTEIDDDGPPIPHEDVVRLQIEMYESAIVEIGESPRDLFADCRDVDGREPAVSLEQRPKRRAFDVFEDDVRHVVFDIRSEDPLEARVGNRRDEFGLGPEPPCGLALIRRARTPHLHSDRRQQLRAPTEPCLASPASSKPGHGPQ